MKIAAAALVWAIVGAAAVAAPARVDPANLSDIAKVLASPEFKGRGPGTAGEAKTIDYLVGRFKALGMQPGGKGGNCTQLVPLLKTQVGSGSMTVTGTGPAMPMVQGREIYVSTVRPVDRVAIAAAPMVFVGYGVTAPERQWDDFKGVDLHGKIAVFLVNDPDFEAAASDGAAGKFGGRRMTFYGRWVYKYEEAARRGAVGALIVHDTPGAGYGWSTVIAPGGENFDIVRADPTERVLLQGWIEGGTATSLFQRAGLDLAKLRVQARQPGFRPVELGALRFAADLPVTHNTVKSHNVLARLDGSKYPDEAVMFGAHWDAYGIGKPDAQGRTIRPGANDDALGVAGVLELARLFAAGPRPERTLMFGLWTAEERGLLGSETYAVDPALPFAKTVANLTLDILQNGGPSHDVLLVGVGQNDLERDLTRAAAAQGRTVTPETLAERGLFYRADHFSLARRGVPTLLLMAISGAPDLVAGGRPAGQKWLDAYMACYHQPCDAWSADWDLRGAADDVELFHVIGTELANSRRWPQWQPGSEFKALRDATGSERR